MLVATWCRDALQPYYASKRIDRDTFKDIARSATSRMMSDYEEGVTGDGEERVHRHVVAELQQRGIQHP